MILRTVRSNTADSINVEISHVKTPAYVSDELATTLKGNFAPYVVLPLIIIFLRMTYGLL
jgi:ATP-binding cassette, subfamily A (ABC1), member 3